MTAILEILSNALGAFGNFFKWKASGVAQRKAAETMVGKAEDAERRRKAEVNRMCHEGDAAAVNRLLNGCLAAALALCLCGCGTPTAPVYVAADREVSCETNVTGRVLYWKVPPLVMEELLNSRAELEEIKRESKVKEIAK